MMRKPKLSEEQRQQLRAVVVASVRDVLNRREEIQQQAATARAVWKALMEAPQWSIARIEPPDDGPTPDEHWSVIPKVTKP